MTKKPDLELELENKPRDYVTVRVQIVHVKGGLFGLRDKVLGSTSVIPNTSKEAINLWNKLQKMFDKYGKRMSLGVVES